MLRNFLITVTLLSSLPLLAFQANATEHRCGWLQNPTPGNWWLNDKDGRWIISAQGGYQAQGMDNLPNISDDQYVKTNGYHGYGCACLDVETNDNMQITSIQGGQASLLEICRKDNTLPKP